MMSEEKIDYLIKKFEEDREETKMWRDRMDKRMESAEHQLYLYKTLIFLFRWIAGALVVILTFKGGDIVKYFSGSH